MAFRILRYSVLLVDTFLREHPKAKLLPAVLPFVLYNGQIRWTAPLSVADIIDLPEDFKDLLGGISPGFDSSSTTSAPSTRPPSGLAHSRP